MNISQFKKYSKFALAIGTVVLIASIVCFVFLGISLGNMKSDFGYKPTVSEAREMLDQAEGMAQMFGGDISDVLGMSGFQVFLIRFSISMRIPLLVVSILLIGAGAGLCFVHADSQAMERAKTGIAHGISNASVALKGTIDKATSKCPQCGKVCSVKTAFCPSCGTKTIKPEPTVSAAKTSRKSTYTCPNCKKVYAEKVIFCSACGQKMPDETPKESRCGNCGATNAPDARYCTNCGNKLDISVHEEAREVPDRHLIDRTEAEKPLAEVVPDTKNPFLNKPKEL